jgi:hypothetical protein
MVSVKQITTLQLPGLRGKILSIASLAIWAVVIGAFGKSSDLEPEQKQGGFLYYSEADALIWFDFDTGKEKCALFRRRRIPGMA